VSSPRQIAVLRLQASRRPILAAPVPIEALRFTRLPPADPGSTPVRLYQAIRSGGGITYMPEAAKALRRRGFSVQQIKLRSPEVAYLRAQGASAKVGALAFVVRCVGRVRLSNQGEIQVIYCGPPPATLLKRGSRAATSGDARFKDPKRGAVFAVEWVNRVADARKWTPAQRTAGLTAVQAAATQPKPATTGEELFTRLVQRWPAAAIGGAPAGWMELTGAWRSALGQASATAGDRGAPDAAEVAMAVAVAAMGVPGRAVKAATVAVEPLVRDLTAKVKDAGAKYVSPALRFVPKGAISSVQFFSAAAGFDKLTAEVLERAKKSKQIWNEMQGFYQAYTDCMQAMGTVPVDQAERNDMVEIRDTLARFAQPASLFSVGGGAPMLGDAPFWPFADVGVGTIFATNGALPAGLLLSEHLPSLEESEATLRRLQARACQFIKNSNRLASVFSSRDKRQSLACLAKVCPTPESGPSLTMVAGVSLLVGSLAWVGLRRRRG
jgi:hypothetical protein